MNQTLTIHYTATFLSWHRYYIHLFEEALRGECEYQGNLPVGANLLPRSSSYDRRKK